MKKLLFTALMVCLTMTAMAQYSNKTISIGVRGGLPVSDAYSDLYSFSVDADISYHTYVYENFMIGGAAGYGHVFGEDISIGGLNIEVDDYQYIPVLASAKLYAGTLLYLGLQPGYAFALGDNQEGGFMFRAQAGFNITENMDIVANYQNILLDTAFPTVNLGLNFYP
ncbi:hypothetical protein [Robertkochia flava]|uniref:hypothetical protein n=1 Tax=Robertkochia flava TaxID=3447986 RepID=UPI001CC9058A|nr:hypothetical protein [Robertkochia marina]